MNCPHCNAEISEHDFNCPECGKLTARTREDLNRTDPRVARNLGWSVAGVGILGFIFVIANSGTDWFSGLDFVGPAGLLVVGAIIALSGRKR
jgi:hypothetical protein